MNNIKTISKKKNKKKIEKEKEKEKRPNYHKYGRSFEKLYKRIQHIINFFLPPTKNSSDRQKTTIMLLEEYYKWLLILRKNNGAENISPSFIIDKIWHIHILDTKDYAYICNKIAGYMLHHITRDNYNFSQEWRKRYKKTMKLYKKMFDHVPKERKIFWKKYGEIIEDEPNISLEPNSFNVFIRLWYNVNISFTITEKTTVEELKLMLMKQNKKLMQIWGIRSSTEMRLIAIGKQLDDTRTVYDYGLREGSYIHLIFRLRGC